MEKKMFVNIHLLIILALIKGLSSNDCYFIVNLKQNLRSEGFHRNITYGIVFNNRENEDKWLYKDCIVGIDQVLPPGVFVNPDELGDLRRANRVNAVPKNRVNIELPAEQSSESNVFIISKITENKVNLWLPVHARYHKAVPGAGTARKEIEGPKLYLRCNDERLNVCGATLTPVTFLCNGSSKEKCNWKEITYTLMTDTLIWDIPVGNTDHYYVVATGTLLVIIAGSLYLLKAIHGYQIDVKKKKA